MAFGVGCGCDNRVVTVRSEFAMPPRRVRPPGSRRKCQYKGCNNVQKDCVGKRFFCFPDPVKKPELFKQWVINTENYQILNSVAKNFLDKGVCADHFKDSSFRDCRKIKLRPNAVPEPRECDTSDSSEIPPLSSREDKPSTTDRPGLNTSSVSTGPSANQWNPSLSAPVGPTTLLDSPSDNKWNRSSSITHVAQPSWILLRETCGTSTGLLQQLHLQGVPILTVVKPPHSHAPSTDADARTDRECSEARLRIRDLCLRDRGLRPCDVLEAVAATASPPVKEYINRCKLTIKRDIRGWRSCTTTSTLEDGDGVKRAKASSNKSNNRKRKKKEGVTPGIAETSTSTCSKDDSSSSMPIASDCEASTSKRNFEEIGIKQEGVKEELILEDYGNPIDSMEYQSSEETEVIANLKEDVGVAHSSTSTGEEGPFETIICGSGDVKVKEEILEDESGAYGSSIDVDPISTWSDPIATQPSEPLTTEIPQCALPINIDSKTAPKVRSPQNKSLKQIAKRRVKSSEKLLKSVPVLGVEKCHICVNEVFSSPSDLVEHCILKHSDASSRFYPAVEPSSQQHLIATGSPGLHTAATPPDHSAATTPGYSAANTPGQPPHHWIPPYISACDVFDGVFVSLRNVPVNNRKATRDKILELVKLLSTENVDPTLVNFSVMGK